MFNHITLVQERVWVKIPLFLSVIRSNSKVSQWADTYYYRRNCGREIWLNVSLSHLFWFHCCTTSIELLILKSLQLDKTSEIIYSVFSQPERGCEGGEWANKTEFLMKSFRSSLIMMKLFFFFLSSWRGFFSTSPLKLSKSYCVLYVSYSSLNLLCGKKRNWNLLIMACY